LLLVVSFELTAAVIYRFTPIPKNDLENYHEPANFLCYDERPEWEPGILKTLVAWSPPGAKVTRKR
jgi:hypothetical protein